MTDPSLNFTEVTAVYHVCLIELGDSAESKFDLILFDSLLLRHSRLRPFVNCGLHCQMCSQIINNYFFGITCKMHSDVSTMSRKYESKKNISLSIFRNFRSRSEE